MNVATPELREDPGTQSNAGRSHDVCLAGVIAPRVRAAGRGFHPEASAELLSASSAEGLSRRCARSTRIPEPHHALFWTDVGSPFRQALPPIVDPDGSISVPGGDPLCAAASGGFSRPAHVPRVCIRNGAEGETTDLASKPAVPSAGSISIRSARRLWLLSDIARSLADLLLPLEPTTSSFSPPRCAY